MPDPLVLARECRVTCGRVRPDRRAFQPPNGVDPELSPALHVLGTWHAELAPAIPRLGILAEYLVPSCGRSRHPKGFDDCLSVLAQSVAKYACSGSFEDCRRQYAIDGLSWSDAAVLGTSSHAKSIRTKNGTASVIRINADAPSVGLSLVGPPAANFFHASLWVTPSITFVDPQCRAISYLDSPFLEVRGGGSHLAATSR